MLDRSQGWVSYVESGQTALHIIELRQWLAALGVDFLAFLNELDADLQLDEVTRARANQCYRATHSAIGRRVQAGMSIEVSAAAPAQAAKPTKRQVRR